MSVTQQSLDDLASAQAAYLEYHKTGKYRGQRFINEYHFLEWERFRRRWRHLLFWSLLASKDVRQHYRDWISICNLFIASLQRDYDDAHKQPPHPAWYNRENPLPTPGGGAHLIPPRPPQPGDLRA